MNDGLPLKKHQQGVFLLIILAAGYLVLRGCYVTTLDLRHVVRGAL